MAKIKFNQINAIDVNDIGFDVVLLAGQSNAVGYGTNGSNDGIDLNYDYLDPRIWQYPSSGNYLNKPIVAQEPLLHTVPRLNNIGFGFNFCKELILRTPSHRRILIIPCASGGTGFSDNRWNPGDDLYNFAVSQTNAAIALSPKNRIVSIIWHQGEKDTNVLTKTAYAAALDSMIAGMRTAITDADNCPFIVGESVRSWIGTDPGRVAILEATQELPSRVAYTAVASSLNLTVVPGDDNHFDATSQRILAKRYFDGYVTSLENIPSVPNIPTDIVFSSVYSNIFTFNWTQVGSATSYVIQYKESTSSTWLNASNPTKPYTLTGRQPSTSYDIQIKAVRSGLESSYSATATQSTGADVTIPTPLFALNFQSDYSDSSGNSNNGTNSGCSIVSDSLRGQVLSVPGGNGVESKYVSVAVATSASYSKSAWVKFSEVYGSSNIISFAGSNDDQSHVLWASNSSFNGSPTNFSFRAGHGPDIQQVWADSNTSITLNQWYHVFVSYNNSDRKYILMVNGVKVAESTASTNFTGSISPTLIGSYRTSGTVVMNGRVDNAKLWNSALTEAQGAKVFSNELI